MSQLGHIETIEKRLWSSAVYVTYVKRTLRLYNFEEICHL